LVEGPLNLRNWYIFTGGVFVNITTTFIHTLGVLTQHYNYMMCYLLGQMMTTYLNKPMICLSRNARTISGLLFLPGISGAIISSITTRITAIKSMTKAGTAGTTISNFFEFLNLKLLLHKKTNKSEIYLFFMQESR
jgi:hypothetical protein